MSVVPDLNGDGLAEILLAGFQAQDLPNDYAGRTFAVFGVDTAPH